MRTGWPSAEKTSVRGCKSRRWIPSRDSKNAIAWPAPRTPPASSMPSISSRSLATLSMKYAAASSKTPWVTTDARAIPSTKSGFFCAPHTRRLTPRQKERLREAFVADEAHISVEVAYLHRASARGLPSSHTRPRPTPGRTSRRAPTACPIPEIARLGRTLRKWKDAFLAYFDTSGASNAPHRSHQQNHRTRKTHRQRLPQPHQLPTPNAPHHRRPRRLHPHSTMKTPLIHRQYRKHCSVSQGLDRLTTSNNSNYNQQHYKLCNSLE